MSKIAAARSFLFVPGDRPERIDKAIATGADVVIIDLEDAVEPAHKEQARTALEPWLDSPTPVVIRINAPDSPWHEDDLALVSRHRGLVMVPKSEDVTALERVARATRSGGVIALIETARGVERAAEIALASGVERLAIGNVDLAAQLGIDPDDQDALRYARSRLVMASAHGALPGPIDGVTLALDDEVTLRADLVAGRRLGFAAKMCIHPRQVRPVNEEFSPTPEQVIWARSIVAEASEGVSVHEGKMVDRPVILRAETILERHRALDR
ncbi:CoA ester lyase [soil metagenome]